MRAERGRSSYAFTVGTNQGQGAGNPRHPYRAEVELAAPVEAWLRGRGSECIAYEVEGDYGIADIVAGYGEHQKLKNRRRQVGAVPSSLHLDLLEYCAEWRTVEELRVWAPHGYSSLRQRAIDPLVDRGLMRFEGTRIRSIRNPRDPFDKIVAVELKLREGARGVEQANAYRLFADESYLAMPEGRFSEKVTAAAVHYRIGLLVVSPDGVEEVLSPRPSTATSQSRRRLASEHVLRARDFGSARPAGSPIQPVRA